MRTETDLRVSETPSDSIVWLSDTFEAGAGLALKANSKGPASGPIGPSILLPGSVVGIRAIQVGSAAIKDTERRRLRTGGSGWAAVGTLKVRTETVAPSS